MGTQHALEVQGYDATTIFELEALIRQKIKNRGSVSLRTLETMTGISHTHIMNFEHGSSVCIMVLNRLANYYGIHYKVENFKETGKPFIG